MKSHHNTLQQLISPEIFVEIQTSFLKKHGAAVCIFDSKLQPLLTFPQHLPALVELSAEQQDLFESFFNLSFLDAELLQKNNRHSFSDNTVCRSVFPITFDDEFLGLALILHFSQTIHPEHDKPLLQTLSLVKHKSISLKTMQDETKPPDYDMKPLVQEMQNILQLFLEAGMARAQVSPFETERADKIEPASSEVIDNTAILFCAPDGQIVDSAANAARLLGYGDPGALCDLNFLTHLLATDYDREKIRMLFHEKPGTQTSVALVLKDESTIQVDVQVNVQRTSSGVIGFECLLSIGKRDSESEQTEPNLPAPELKYDEKRLAELQAHYQLMQARLAHITTPLSQKLEKFFHVKVQDESIKRELSDIQRLLKSLSHLNQQLACFVLKRAPQREATDVNQLLTRMASQLKKLMAESISINIKIEDDLPPVLVNSELLVHAIGSLCKNAIEAMPSGGTLVLGARLKNSDNVELFVADSGPGFDASVHNNLFEPFCSTRKNINAGLGLPAVFGIVKSHDGDISISSEKSGATVSLIFPADTSRKEKVDVKGYVLIVDDEQELAEVTAMALRRAHYGVFTCTSCEQAFDVIGTVGHKVNLFIIDNQLVGATGVTCAQGLMAKAPNIPMLFYSGEDDLELMKFIQQVGAGWLKKPFSAKELLARVDSLISEKK